MDHQPKNMPEVDAEVEFGPTIKRLQDTGQMLSTEELARVDEMVKQRFLKLMAERSEREKQEKLAAKAKRRKP